MFHLDHEYHNAAQSGLLPASLDLVPSPINSFTPFWRWHQIRPRFRAYLHQVIQQRQQQGDLQVSVEQMIDELLQLVSGAHFTVARALTWSMVELAAKPNLRLTLQEEL